MTSLRIANELLGRENQHQAGEDFQLLLYVTQCDCNSTPAGELKFPRQDSSNLSRIIN
jgi:hypothetical protein